MSGILYVHTNTPTWLASLFIPGWGQLCQERGTRAAWHFAQWCVCLTLALAWSAWVWLAVPLVALGSTVEAFAWHRAELTRRQALARTMADPARSTVQASETSS